MLHWKKLEDGDKDNWTQLFPFPPPCFFSCSLWTNAPTNPAPSFFKRGTLAVSPVSWTIQQSHPGVMLKTTRYKIFNHFSTSILSVFLLGFLSLSYFLQLSALVYVIFRCLISYRLPIGKKMKRAIREAPRSCQWRWCNGKSKICFDIHKKKKTSKMGILYLIEFRREFTNRFCWGIFFPFWKYHDRLFDFWLYQCRW